MGLFGEEEFRYSLLIAYRDRDIKLVERCLHSIFNQSYQEFELIFIDYGSQEENITKVKSLFQKPERFKYKYVDTRGMFWNKSNALNKALKFARGERIVIVDVDLILPNNFLQVVENTFEANTFINYLVYYLPPNFNNYQNLTAQAESLKKKLNKSDTHAHGPIVVLKSDLEAIGGYDEFYRIWGREDTDVVLRLQKKGLLRKKLDQAQAVVFHQWHNKNNLDLPLGWDEKTKKYLKETQTRNLTTIYSIRESLPEYISQKQQDRPALELFLSDQLTEQYKFTIEYPSIDAYTAFMSRFDVLNTGEYVWIKQKFAFFKASKSSKIASLIDAVNKLFRWIKISYRMVDILTYETALITEKEIRDFIFYFILHYERTRIADYYFEIKDQEVTLIIVKQ